jgi:hypothetical protein
MRKRCQEPLLDLTPSAVGWVLTQLHLAQFGPSHPPLGLDPADTTDPAVPAPAGVFCCAVVSINVRVLYEIKI